MGTHSVLGMSFGEGKDYRDHRVCALSNTEGTHSVLGMLFGGGKQHQIMGTYKNIWQDGFLMTFICRAEVNGWWPGKVVNLMMREEGRAMAQVIYPFMVILLKMVVMTLMIKTIDHNLCYSHIT